MTSHVNRVLLTGASGGLELREEATHRARQVVGFFHSSKQRTSHDRIRSCRNRLGDIAGLLDASVCNYRHIPSAECLGHFVNGI